MATILWRLILTCLLGFELVIQKFVLELLMEVGLIQVV